MLRTLRLSFKILPSKTLPISSTVAQFLAEDFVGGWAEEEKKASLSSLSASWAGKSSNAPLAAVVKCSVSTDLRLRRSQLMKVKAAQRIRKHRTEDRFLLEMPYLIFSSMIIFGVSSVEWRFAWIFLLFIYINLRFTMLFSFIINQDLPRWPPAMFFFFRQTP